MATIGTFSQKDGKWTGTIRTMTINVKAQMVSVTEKAEGGPDYRIFAGGANSVYIDVVDPVPVLDAPFTFMAWIYRDPDSPEWARILQMTAGKGTSGTDEWPCSGGCSECLGNAAQTLYASPV